jgi:AcrR family transcriptional regulator
MSSVEAPRLRADAARNRALLLATARDAFAASEDDTTVSLEGIARAAGVGIGTLYRHFPTREALVEALYVSELDGVAKAAGDLLAEHFAFDALRLWMDRYTRFVATKQGMANALRAAWASGSLRMSDTRASISGAIGRMLEAGASDGTIRDDVTADEVTDMLVGMFLATGDAKDERRVGRLLDLLADGLRPR